MHIDHLGIQLSWAFIAGMVVTTIVIVVLTAREKRS